VEEAAETLMLPAGGILRIAQIVAPGNPEFRQDCCREFIKIFKAMFPDPSQQLLAQERLALAGRASPQMPALLVIKECLYRF